MRLAFWFKLMMLGWSKATEILRRCVTFQLENGFMMTLTLSLVQKLDRCPKALLLPSHTQQVQRP